MALIAEECVGAAPVGRCIAAIVALVLDVAQAVLLTHEFLEQICLLESTSLASEMRLVHSFFFSVFQLLFDGAVNVATEERLPT
jgi:hypothetical protein